METFPEGKYLGSVKIGPKGQIVIPKEARDMFDLKQGDTLVLMADKSSGIALQPFSFLQTLWTELGKAGIASDKKEDENK